MASGLVNTQRAGRRRDRPGRAGDARERAHRRHCCRRRLGAGALNSGFHLAYLIGAALVLVAIAVVVTVLRPVAMPAMAHGEAPEGEPVPEGEPAYSEV